MGLSFKNDGLRIGNGIGNCLGLKNHNYATHTLSAHQTLSFNNQSDYSGVFFDNSKAIITNSSEKNPYAGNLYGIGIKLPKRNPFVKDLKLPVISINYGTEKPAVKKSSALFPKILSFAVPVDDVVIAPKVDIAHQIDAGAKVASVKIDISKEKEVIHLASKGFDEGEGGLLLLREKSGITNMIHKKLSFRG